jgi:hypothetical protein
MKIYYPLTIDLYNPYLLPVMNAQQNNIGRGAMVTLIAGGAVIELDHESVQIYIKKPDGTKVYASCSLDGGRIRVDFTNQMLAAPGKAQAELEVTSGQDRITTPIFIINVQKSNIDDEAIESSNEFSVLQQMIALAQQAAGEATGAAAAANRAAEAAGSAADNASQAASDASGAAGAATSAAQSATSAASSANTAAGSANSAATAANEAAAAANEAAGKIPNLKPIATSGLASDVAIRAIQGMAATDVQAALAEQYSKISTLPMFPLSASLGSVEAATDFYDNISSTMPDRTWYRRAASHNISVPVLGTGVYYIDGLKTSALYEWQRATSYGNGSPRSFMRAKYGGIWGDWQQIFSKSDFTYTDVTIDVAIGGTPISDIPVENRIPVILRASVAYDGLGIYGALYQKQWIIKSNHAQNVTIRFYNYPV